MLFSLYQTHLENQLSRSEFLFLALLIHVLQQLKQVSLEKIANALPLPILFESRRKKVQRFLSQPNLNIPNIWFPILHALADSKFCPESNALFSDWSNQVGAKKLTDD